VRAALNVALLLIDRSHLNKQQQHFSQEGLDQTS
jgi:hypothetical protein